MSAEDTERSRDVEYEIDAISRVSRIRRSRKVKKGRKGARRLRHIKACRVPEETEAMKGVGTPPT
jgi:hypothetical protein